MTNKEKLQKLIDILDDVDISRYFWSSIKLDEIGNVIDEIMYGNYQKYEYEGVIYLTQKEYEYFKRNMNSELLEKYINNYLSYGWDYASGKKLFLETLSLAQILNNDFPETSEYIINNYYKDLK